VLEAQDRRRVLPRQAIGLGLAARQAGERAGTGHGPGVAADRQREKLAADLELTMRGGQGGACLRQPRLGLGDVGAGVLADLEAVAGGAQLLRHHADVGLAHVDHLQVAPHVQVGRDRVQQHLLFDRHEALPRGQNRLARCLDRQPAAVAGIEHPFRHEAGGARGRVGDQIAVRSTQRRTGSGGVAPRPAPRPRHRAQKEAVLFQKR
jgi:hypothetical protein